MNKAIIIGRLGADPIKRYVGEDNPVCNFSVATTERWKDKKTGEQKERTDWHRVVVWGNLADIASVHCHKGDRVAVEGRNETRTWEHKTGVKMYTTEIKADRIEFLGRAKDEQQEDSPPADGAGTSGDDDDLPF